LSLYLKNKGFFIVFAFSIEIIPKSLQSFKKEYNKTQQLKNRVVLAGDL